MNILKKIWNDPVGSGIIRASIITSLGFLFRFLIKKCRPKLTKSNRKKLFTVLGTKPIQKGNHACIKVRFESNDAVDEFQRREGWLVGYDNNLIGFIRQDCPILQEHMASIFFRLRKLFRLKQE